MFGVRHAELRVGSGALANLYAFMATCRPGDTIVVPPATIGGHITHRPGGAAGLYGLDIHEYAIDADRFTVDLDSLARLVERVHPRLITVGASVNLLPHPVAAVRAIADRVGATVMFDAAHACGLFAGRARHLNVNLKINHFSNGNIFTENAGVKIPLTFGVGYAF